MTVYSLRSQAPDLAPTACFSLTADSDPATLPRVLEVFAKLGRLPSQCHASTFGAEEQEMHIDLQFTNMDQSEGEHMARALRGCLLVNSVLTSQKEQRLIA